MSKIKRNGKVFLKTQNNFFKMQTIFTRWLYRVVYYLNVGICGASISKILTNTKHKNLKVTFCNPTEPHHCTVYAKFFLKPNLTWSLMQEPELAIFEKLIFNVLHGENVKKITQIHSELSIQSSGISCAFIERITTGYRELPYALQYILPYYYENLTQLYQLPLSTHYQKCY